MSSEPPRPLAAGRKGWEYDAAFAERARQGVAVHGEADFVEGLGVHTVLDAGCGTGRVAIELARRGLAVVGVDRDPVMLEVARAKAPGLEWVEADLAGLVLPDARDPERPRAFDAVVMAGNVMIFVDPGSEGAVVAALARHLGPGGRLVAGFQLLPGRLDLGRYDAAVAAAGLALVERHATWDRRPWTSGGDYAVSVHRRPG